jgi:protein involved in polysaccharide export with SLBB domain
MELPLGTDYVVGPGDMLEVNIYGGYSAKLVRPIDHEGRLALPEVSSVLVGGMTLGEAQAAVKKALSRQFRDVGVDVSINRLRRVRVYVVGDVKRPGGYDVSPLSTPLTALLAAGGPSDSGSYRLLSHFRGKKRLADIDLYEWMLKGMQSSGGQLQSGDSILVPPVGPQVGVAGMVKRPALYELSKKEETMADVIELAGGILVAGAVSDIKVERVEAHQRRVMMSLRLDPNDKLATQAGMAKFIVSDGDRITISPILPYSDKVVFLQGHVFRPGSFPYWEGMTVRDLVQSYQNLLPEPAEHVEVVRLKAPDYRPSVMGISLTQVLGANAQPIGLEPFDTVRIFGRYESDAPTVSIYGQVMRPGEYPLSEGMTAADLVKLSGGFKRSAYMKLADLSSYNAQNGERVVLDHREVEIQKALSGEADTDVRLKPGDVLTIRQLAQWSEIGGSINVAGAVLYPGRYGIQQGEKLSSVLRRAGGFSSDSYPMGAVLERTQVKEIASRSRDQLVQRLESQAFDKNNTADTQVQASQQRQRLIERLKQASPSGRLVIQIDPDITAWENTPTDIEVRPGDTLFIPKQPNFVLVDGQVYSPSAITFSPGKSASWYLKQAGGPTEFANRKDVFVVRANGSVIGRDSGSWWTGGILNTKMNAGDTLVVPEKIVTGSTFWKDLAQSAQVVSAVAIAARVATSF